MAKCDGCNKSLRQKEYIECLSCKRTFHPLCVSMSLITFDKLSAEAKRDWTCPACKSSKPKVGNLNTPIAPGNFSTYSPPVMSTTIPPVSTLSESFDNTTFMDEIKQIRIALMKLQDIPNAVASLRTEIHDIKHSMEFHSGIVEELNKKISAIESRLSGFEKLRSDYDILSNKYDHLRAEMHQRDQFARRKNIEIVGVPEKKGENLISIAQELARCVKFDLNPIEIDFITRVTPKEASKKPKPIIIKLQSRLRKDNFLSALRKKKGLDTRDAGLRDGEPQPIYANEHLTPENKHLLIRPKTRPRRRGISTFGWRIRVS